MTRVRGSSSQYSSRSLPDTSALFPSDANIERPRPSCVISARIASPSAPLCDENAMLPASGSVVAENVPCSRNAGSLLITPMQFGPIIRMPYRRTMSRTSASNTAPSSPTSLNPAVMTTMPRTPLRPQDSTCEATKRRGTAMIARSTSSGIASTVG